MLISDKALTPGRPAVCNDVTKLAPRFRAAVEAAIADCHAAGLDAIIYETTRSDDLQRAYYELGRTVVPPHQTVTNAQDARHGWHFFGLAVDVISKKREWDVPQTWCDQVAAIFKSHGLKWGGDWHHPDLPHYQWGQCLDSPSDHARELYDAGGSAAVWAAVGAA